MTNFATINIFMLLMLIFMLLISFNVLGILMTDKSENILHCIIMYNVFPKWKIKCRYNITYIHIISQSLECCVHFNVNFFIFIIYIVMQMLFIIGF